MHMDEELIELWVNGRLVNWPKKEYLDYVAWQQGFEDYDDYKHVISGKELKKSKKNKIARNGMS